MVCSWIPAARSAKRYPDIEFEDMIVDATAMKLVVAPERFDVIVTMNLFGDILSDLAAGLIAVWGFAPRRTSVICRRRRASPRPSARARCFEAVQGPRRTSPARGIANPTGLMLSAAMLL